MTSNLETIKEYETRLEEALSQFEEKEKLQTALEIYQQVENSLLSLEGISPESMEYFEQQRVLAFCMLRQANIYRQLGKMEKANQLSEREITAARASGIEIAIARSLMSYGATCLAQGKKENGLEYFEEAEELFSHGESYDHKQGLGWIWILKGDLTAAQITDGNDVDILEAYNKALAVLKPIDNWQGIIAAYEKRIRIFERLGEDENVKAEKNALDRYKEDFKNR